MNKIMRVLMVALLAAAVLSGAAFAYGSSSGSKEINKPAIVDVGNKFCPVTGEKVDGKSFYDYNGKRYGLCCPMCVGAFSKEPMKYSAIAEKE